MGKMAEDKLNDSKEKALAELSRIADSRNRVEEAYRQAQQAYEKVQNAKNSSDRTYQLKIKISKFTMCILFEIN